ncbi:hypothetical protein CMUST_07245 [Corynebacterium mustelae]|uniref:Polymer-forming cytoskeletal n=1 Tax=Corynebacterium mustelae TaxID=571915 RepID=A0A0G3GX90_9CORY|nr:hypothetical protein [Corynebacterium mustelae]AKK05779.1 hypothetical protein CMUST_07245 [Corynebacterium mustelae]
MHFELTGETRINSHDVTLYRIRAARSIPEHSIVCGELGGWVSSTHTANGKPRIGEGAWVFADAQVFDQARVTGHAVVTGNAQVFGRAKISGHALIEGHARVCGKSVIKNRARVSGNSLIDGATVAGHAQVSGEAEVLSTNGLRSRVCDNATVIDARIDEGSIISGNAQVMGYVSVYSSHISGNAWVESYGTIADSKVRDNAVVLASRLNEVVVEGDAKVYSQPRVGSVIGGNAVIKQLSDYITFTPLSPEWTRVHVYRNHKDEPEVRLDFFRNLEGTHSTDVAEFVELLKKYGWDQPMCAQLEAARAHIAQQIAEYENPTLGYELTDTTKTLDDGTVVYRVRWRDSGLMGGWMPGTHTPEGEPRVTGTARLDGEAMLLENASITEDARVRDTACVRGDAHIAGHAIVCDNAEVSGKAFLDGLAEVGENAEVSGNALIFDSFVYGSCHVSGNTRMYRGAHLSGQITMSGECLIIGAQVEGKATVEGCSQITTNTALKGTYTDLET